MSQHTISPEITHAPEHSGGTGRIWKIFWVLSVLTLLELGLGYFMYAMHTDLSHTSILATKAVIAILTMLKAYYIVSVFMHLGDEIRNMIMTITVPLILFIWFIIAFLWDGNSWKKMRNTDAGSHPSTEQVEQHVTKQGSKD